MILLSDVLDLDNLAKMVAEGYINRKETGSRVLYDYAPQAQWGSVWNNETRRCRGLVATHDGQLLARPFEKFHNLQEHLANPSLPPVPVEPFDVYEKVDGSLIIAYNYGGHVTVNTRGSFASEQAGSAATWLRENHPDIPIPPDQTWLFEWIAPNNRIVVDYGERRELVLLAVIDNATGLDLPLPNKTAWPFARVQQFDCDSLDELPELDNTEGYVVRFESGMRVKMKTAEYVRLHKILTGVSAKTIWEALSKDDGLDKILDRVPDEFYRWATKVADDLLDAFMDVEGAARFAFRDLQHLADDRKAFALEAVKSDHRAILFAMLDNKPIAPLIWRQLKPAAERPFREAEE